MSPQEFHNRINALASDLVSDSTQHAKTKRLNVDKEIDAKVGAAVSLLTTAIEQARKATRSII